MGNLVGLEACDAVALEEDFASTRQIDTANDIEQRGFASSIGPDNGGNGVPIHMKRDTCQGHDATKRLVKLNDFKHGANAFR